MESIEEAGSYENIVASFSQINTNSFHTLSVSSQEYLDICGERDGVAFAKRRRRDVCASWRRSDKEIDAVPPPPFGLMGVAGNLCVARRRRCPCIAFSSLLDLTSQDPSANVMVFLGRDTMSTLPQADYWLWHRVFWEFVLPDRLNVLTRRQVSSLWPYSRHPSLLQFPYSSTPRQHPIPW